GDVNNYIKPVDQIFTIAQYETKNVVGQYIPVIYAPIILIISPFNIIYDRAIALGLQFFVSLNVPGDWCGFEVDGAANVTMSGAGGLIEHQYRKQINISNTAGNLTDYQVNLTVNTSQLISAGKMLVSCNNTRFTWLNSSSGQEQNISYWLESGCNTSSTIYWIKVPFLKNNTNTTVYMYYGNSAANSTTLFNSTFTKQFNVTAGGSSDNSIVGEWHMDEGSGTGVNDSSGNSRHCTIQGSVPWQSSDGGQWDNRNDVNGSYVGFFRGSNLYFNNNPSNYVSGGWITTVPNTFTMEIWVNTQKSVTICSQSTSGTCGTSGQSYAIFPSNGGSSDAGAGISVGTNAIQVFEHANSYMPALLSYNVILSGWNHIVVVYTNKQPKLYLNGNLVKTGLASLRSNVYPSYTFSDAATSYGPFSGYLDETKIYNKALGIDEIKAHYERRKYAFPSPSPTIGTEEQITPNNYINFSYFNSSMDGGQRYVRFWCNDTAGTMNYSGTYFTTPNYYHDTFDDELGIYDKNNVNISNGDVKILDISEYIGGFAYRKPINIFNTAGNLTDYKVAIDPQLFNTTGLVGSWHFSEGTGTLAKDSSGSGNDGTLTNFNWNSQSNWTVGYNDTGTGINFDGTNDYVNMPNSASLNITGNITIETWGYIKSDRLNPFVSKRNGASPVNYEFNTGSNRSLGFHFYNGAWRGVDTQKNVFNLSAWVHFAVTYDMSNIKIYVNGLLVNSTPQTNALLSDGNPIRIGRTYDGSSNYYFNGSMDEVRIYNRSLSQAEILQHYNESKARLDYADMIFTWVNASSGQVHNISYWFGQDNRIWIKVPFLKNNTNTHVYMYYGNSSAKSTSNNSVCPGGSENGYCYEFYDDFSDGGYTTNPTWTVESGSYSASNYYLRNTMDGIENKITSSVDLNMTSGVIEHDVYFGSIYSYYNQIYLYNSTDHNISVFGAAQSSFDSNYYVLRLNEKTLSYTLSTGTWYNIKMVFNRGSYELFLDGQSKINATNSTFLNIKKIGHRGWQASASNSRWDNFKIRQYASPEPTVTVGAAIANLISVAITPISFSTWDKFCADDTIVQGTNITYALLNAINNQAIPGFENMPSGCTNISSLVFSSVRLFAKLTANSTDTPLLHSWNISWSSTSCSFYGRGCTSDGDCCSGICGTDADNDGTFSQALGHTGTCQAVPKPYTDCNDSNPNFWQTLTCYNDTDNDSYTVGGSVSVCKGADCNNPVGHRGSASSPSDCYDKNANAHPNWGGFGYTVHRGDGSFDYSCDGVETKEYTGASTFSGDVTCINSSVPSGNNGYVSSIPSCGVSGNFRYCSGSSAYSCAGGCYYDSTGFGCPTGSVCGSGGGCSSPCVAWTVSVKSVVQRCH
ncbi:MAG: DUF2341 domain-containing protein, partial [Candidatus Aenigmarchaeota archaeon]|nr:DUF2341 domain-containing protein [Candidatus Aenigmarchaeota archaeon]